MNVHFYLRFCDIILARECPLPGGSGYDIVGLSESATQYLYTPQYRGIRDMPQNQHTAQNPEHATQSGTGHRISTLHRARGIRDTPYSQ